jgi:hypothetical protein
MTHAADVPVTSAAFHPRRPSARQPRPRRGPPLDAESGEALHHWAAPTHPWIDSRLAFHPAGRLLAVGTDRAVRLF